MATQEQVRELLDLIAVHTFYLQLAETKLGHSIPLPREASNPDRSDARIEHSIAIMRQWLALLDLAIQPVQLRDALKGKVPEETSQALVRYFMDKQSHTETDRDKADFIATSLFRRTHSGEFSAPHSHDRYFHIMEVATRFESELFKILGGVSIPDVKDEHKQLLGEFEYLHQEVDDFRSFDQLTDSGIVQRVRDIKQSFADSFYHPKVLANVAVYNAFFGQKFDELFRDTTEQIKSYAAVVQQQGASIMSKVEGEITVKQLTDVQEHQLMSAEYGKAQEQFRKISSYKKAVDKKGGGKRHQPAAAAAVGVSGHKGPVSAPPPPAFREASRTESLAEVSRSTQDALEEGKIQSQLDAIRTFVRVSDKSSQVVPLVKGVITLVPAEVDSFRVDYAHEKSFRADYAAMMCYLVAMAARLTVEQEEFKEKQNSSYLWKPHADAITYVMQAANDTFKRANVVMETAEKRGLEDKVAAIKATMLRVRVAMQEAAVTLRNVPSQS